jgi:hypothetical protein
VKAKRDLGLHVDELLLDQLVGGERPAGLLAVERVVARRMPAELGGAERAPGDAVARVVEANQQKNSALRLGPPKTPKDPAAVPLSARRICANLQQNLLLSQPYPVKPSFPLRR